MASLEPPLLGLSLGGRTLTTLHWNFVSYLSLNLSRSFTGCNWVISCRSHNYFIYFNNHVLHFGNREYILIFYYSLTKPCGNNNLFSYGSMVYLALLEDLVWGFFMGFHQVAGQFRVIRSLLKTRGRSCQGYQGLCLGLAQNVGDYFYWLWQ